MALAVTAGADRLLTGPVSSLLEQIRPAIVKYCSRRLGWAAGYTTAEDITQDVMLALWTALPRYRAQGKPLAFAYRIAHNKVVDAYREASRHAALSFEVPDGVDQRPGPEQLAVAADQNRTMLRLLANLPDLHRRIVLLRVADGLSADEVGAVVGMSATGVRVAQMRALSRLRAVAR